MSIQHDVTLADILWYRIGGKVKTLIEVESAEEFKQALTIAEKDSGGKVFICGLGANLLFPDGYFDGVVIRFVQNTTPNISLTKEGLVQVFAGITLDKVIQFAFKHKLAGLAWAGGLPSTVGAAVRGNVGAFGNEIRLTVHSVDVFDMSIKQTLTLDNDELLFSYRNSVIKEKREQIVLNVYFKLSDATEEEMQKEKETYAKNIEYRQKNHPLEYPSCGSVFKNIYKAEQVDAIVKVWPDIESSVSTRWYGKVAIGYIINRLAFSGKRVGNAQVSEKHANYIVNLGGAKASDVRQIIEELQSKVNDTFGFTPEVEIEIVE